MASHIVLVRHGETEWSRSGRHTSTTDLPLTDHGRAQAAALGRSLAGRSFSLVMASPRRRARETAALVLPEAQVVVRQELAEWNYGEYEGLTSEEILARNPTWDLWREGCPGGESPTDVAARADLLLAFVDEHEGEAACFAHAHILRVVAARWVGLGPEAGGLFLLDTATVSVLGHERRRRVVQRWNMPADGSA
jgi:probable phosphoglycerate mutase